MIKIIPSILAITLLITGCGNSAEKKVDEKGKTIATSISDSQFESDAFIEKYNVYITFENSFNKRVYEAYNRYFEWADIEKGPKESRYIRGIYTLNDFQIKNLEKALAKEPEIEMIDPLMLVVLEKSKILNEVVLESNEYYEKEDYKDDDFAKGELLHGRLVEAFNKYFTAYDAMKVEFVVLQGELFEHEVENLKKNGFIIRYNLKMSLHQAEGIIDTLGELNATELESLDVNKFDAQMTKFITIYDDLEKLVKDQAQLKKEYGDNFGGKAYISSYIYGSRDFIRETRRLRKRIEKNDFKSSRNSDNGTPEKINNVYFDMVEKYNGILGL